MTETLDSLLSELPSSSLTTHVLGALDYVVPGEWTNIISLEDMIRSETGEEDNDVLQQVGERAIAIYADPDQGYQRAVQVYRLVDSGSTVAGVASALRMIGDKVELLDFLQKVTPKPDEAQAVDAAVKLTGELVAFCLTNGFPGDSVSDFAAAIGAAAREDKMRLAAWASLDAVLPLGPDFMGKIMDAVRGISVDALRGHAVFGKVAEWLPGDWAKKKQTLEVNAEAVGAEVSTWVQGAGVTQASLLDRLRQYVEVADDKLDVVAATLDVTTNVFEHTGAQSVARRVVARAYGEI